MYLKTGHDPSSFCWMCQLSTFIQITGKTRDSYNLINVDDAESKVYQRFALHVNYETADGTRRPKEEAYMATAIQAMSQGLCRTLGQNVSISCENTNFSFINRYIFGYVTFSWNTTRKKRAESEAAYLQNFAEALASSSLSESTASAFVRQ